MNLDLTTIKSLLPDFAKDLILSYDSVFRSSNLSNNELVGCGLAASVTANSLILVNSFINMGVLSEEEILASKIAASLMGMTNIWYGYTGVFSESDELRSQPAGLRMNAYANHAGVGERSFELWTLAASIVGRCKYCILAHTASLRKLGLTSPELATVGRIASLVNSSALLISTCK